MGDGIEFSEKQKNEIYVEYLKPLKLRISQILLYDEKSASEFLKKYNDLLENTKDNELLDKITDLEIEIGEYEKKIGKTKRFEEKSKAIISEIDDLIHNENKFSFDEFNEKVQSLLEKYKEDILGYSFKDRDIIEEKFDELRDQLTLRKVKEVDSVEETALVVRTKNDNNIFKRFLSFFSKEPQLPLKEAELSKITIDWLSRYIPKEITEEYKRRKNDVKKDGEIYLPDSKAFIYDFFAEMEKLGINEQKRPSISREYVDENMNKKRIDISEFHFWKVSDWNTNCQITIKKDNNESRCVKNLLIKAEWGDRVEKYGKNIEFRCASPKRNVELIYYAEMLDIIFGTNYRNKMFKAYEQFVINEDEKYLKRNKLFMRLAKSFDKLQKECKENVLDIQVENELKCNTLKNKFISEIKIDPNNMKQNENEKETETEIKKIESGRKKGEEQGGEENAKE